jgi:hypothetical protein
MNFILTFLSIIALLPLTGCKDEHAQPITEESASRSLTAQEAYERLIAILETNETEIVKILHRNAPFMREDFEISLSKKITWDVESHRWAAQIRYGFFGFAEASCNESGRDPKIKITNTEDKVNWTQTIVPDMKESQQATGGNRR